MLVRTRFCLVTVVLGMGSLACKPPPQGPMPICLAEVAAEQAHEAQSQQLPPDVWFSIMLRGFNRSSMTMAEPPRDCRGAEIKHERLTPGTCGADAEPTRPLPARPLTPADLSITPLANGKSLVWVAARHFDNGDALGPIAVVEWIDRGVAVRAIGTLMAHHHKARLRLEPMGDVEVLVIESDVCPDPEKPARCDRVVQLVPLANGHFRDAALVDEAGACLGPATFRSADTKEVALDNGQLRTFEISRTVRFEEGRGEIHEQVTIRDRDPQQPDAPAQIFRQASVQRPLTLAQAGFVTVGGLWDRMLAEHGSVRPGE